jgi:hypothetical protein
VFAAEKTPRQEQKAAHRSRQEALCFRLPSNSGLPTTLGLETLFYTPALRATYSQMVPGSNDEYVIRPAGAHDAQLVTLNVRDMGSRICRTIGVAAKSKRRGFPATRQTETTFIGWWSTEELLWPEGSSLSRN